MLNGSKKTLVAASSCATVPSDASMATVDGVALAQGESSLYHKSSKGEIEVGGAAAQEAAGAPSPLEGVAGMAGLHMRLNTHSTLTGLQSTGLCPLPSLTMAIGSVRSPR